MTENTDTVDNYEEQFAHRFTADDPIYQDYVNRPADPPPIVENWNGRGGNSRGRDNRFTGHHGQRGGGWGGGRGWRGDRGRGWRGEHHRQQDRRWGHESGHQSSHNHGYNQRPYHDY